jgi:hypothetical protein
MYVWCEQDAGHGYFYCCSLGSCPSSRSNKRRTYLFAMLILTTMRVFFTGPTSCPAPARGVLRIMYTAHTHTHTRINNVNDINVAFPEQGHRRVSCLSYIYIYIYVCVCIIYYGRDNKIRGTSSCSGHLLQIARDPRIGYFVHVFIV